MLKTIAENVGKGLAAGLIGTAVMTVSSTIEMKVRGREGSSAPLEAASKVLGFEPQNDAAKKRLSNQIHWAYGTSWGVVRGLIAAAGFKGIGASVVHFAAVWGTALWMLPSLNVAPPVKEWGVKAIAIDALHHAVYAAATGLAYDLIEESGE